jgi:pyruvate/2-oxoglutarate dehydrogenase complex dihydrolipoamide dehydrogenase (E3) component
VRAGRVHRLAREAGRFGTITGEPQLDWRAVVARQHEIVARLRPSPADLERKGARVYLGEARFEDDHTLRIAAGGVARGAGRALQTVRGERIIIAAGSEPVIPPIEGRELGITSNELLFLGEFPSSLVLIGAGVIGLEMASAFADLGAAVTVIGREAEILPQFDPDVAAYLRQILEARGVTFHHGARVNALTGRRGDVVARFTVGDGSREAAPAGREAAPAVRATTVCFTVGRRWKPESLGAEALGFALGRLGLETSADLRTSLPHIWAAGDAAGNMQLTPAAAYEGRVAAKNALSGVLALGGDVVQSDLSVVPQAVFTTPEIARVGLTHAEARRRGVHCHVSTHDMRGASNGVATGEDDGYLKLVFEHGSERVLGVQMVSHAAAELIQLATLAIRCGATADQLSTQLSVHPSHAERFLKIAAHEYHEICEV